MNKTIPLIYGREQESSLLPGSLYRQKKTPCLPITDIHLQGLLFVLHGNIYANFMPQTTIETLLSFKELLSPLNHLCGNVIAFHLVVQSRLADFEF